MSIKKKIVMTFGTFDGIHPGHLDFFRQAKKFGDYLVVSIGRDINIPKFKGKSAHFFEKDRVNLVKQLKIVDKVVLGDKKDFINHIAHEVPNVICLGYDQNYDEKQLRKELDGVGLKKTKIVRLKAFKPNVWKSSLVKSRSLK